MPPNAGRSPGSFNIRGREGESAGARREPLPGRRRRICRRLWPGSPTWLPGHHLPPRGRPAPRAPLLGAAVPSRFLQRKRVALYIQPRQGPARPIPYGSDLFDLGADLKGQNFAPDLGFAGFRCTTPSMPRHRKLRKRCWSSSAPRISVCGGSARIRPLGPGCGDPHRWAGRGGVSGFHGLLDLRAGGRGAGNRDLGAPLDSPSLAGAYRFEVAPGDPSVMRWRPPCIPASPSTGSDSHPSPACSCTARPAGRPGRGTLPTTSRPQVHDSTGSPCSRGRTALAAPDQRPGSAADLGLRRRPPGGLRPAPACAGLFPAYLDVQARHEARPGLWVTPEAGFGRGAVQLFEIPSREEYMDNIVAAFVRQAPVPAGAEHALRYTLTHGGCRSPWPCAGCARPRGLHPRRFGRAPAPDHAPRARIAASTSWISRGRSCPPTAAPRCAPTSRRAPARWSIPSWSSCPRPVAGAFTWSGARQRRWPAGDVILRARLIRDGRFSHRDLDGGGLKRRAAGECATVLTLPRDAL